MCATVDTTSTNAVVIANDAIDQTEQSWKTFVEYVCHGSEQVATQASQHMFG